MLLILAWLIFDEIGDPRAEATRKQALRASSPAQKSAFDEDARRIAASYAKDRGRKLIEEAFR